MNNQENPHPDKKKYLSKEFVYGALVGGLLGVVFSLITHQNLPDAMGITAGASVLVGGYAIAAGLINLADCK